MAPTSPNNAAGIAGASNADAAVDSLVESVVESVVDSPATSSWLSAEAFAKQAPSVVPDTLLAIDALVTDTHAALYKSALRILGGREHSSHELCAKLQLKYPLASTVDIQLVLAALQEQDYQSDQRYTQQALKGMLRKGKGALFIQNKIGQAKPTAAASHMFRHELAQVDWLPAATAARVKRFGEALPSDLADKAKQYRFLLQRGFDIGVISQVLNDNYVEELIEAEPATNSQNNNTD